MFCLLPEIMRMWLHGFIVIAFGRCLNASYFEAPDMAMALGMNTQRDTIALEFVVVALP